MISEQESHSNFNKAMRALQDATTVKQLGRISYQVHAFTNQPITGKFYFPEGKKEIFWASYNERKELLTAKEAEQKQMDQTSTNQVA
jgi:hypothetical protein